MLISRLLSSSTLAIKRSMSSAVPVALMNQLKATQGQTINCKAAVAWEPKAKLDITNIQVRPQKKAKVIYIQVASNRNFATWSTDSKI